MIEIIRNFLIEEGVIDAAAILEYNFEDQCSLFFHLLIDSERLLTVKIVKKGIGIKEYDSQLKAYEVYGDFIPKPILIKSVGQNEFILLESIDYNPLNLGSDFSQRKVWSRDLPAYFCGTRTYINSSVLAQENDYSFLLERLTADVPNEIRIMAGGLIDTLDLDVYKKLPLKPQHCDFSTTNLGVRKGKLIIFDWEDYGRSNTFGLDFTVFVASVLFHNPEAMLTFLNGGGGKRLAFIRAEFLEYSNLSRQEMAPLFIVCYLLFYELKLNLNYGADIICRVRRALETLLRWCAEKYKGLS